MNSSLKTSIAALARHLVTTFGGVLVTAGTIGQEDLQTLAGAAAVIVGIIWSIVEKRNRTTPGPGFDAP